MNLEKLLEKYGRNLETVTKIYHGLDHCCRCGCGGRYFYRGTSGFTRAVNTMKKDEFLPLTPGNTMYTHDGRAMKCEGIGSGKNYLNIPYDGSKDKCYTLYFD